MPKNFLLLFAIIVIAFSVRLINLNFPFFTSDEARIAFRGFTIATFGKDELDRPFPLLFNSLIDYKLPAVSYITALGILLFGRTEFGARLPFIIISILTILLIYKAAEIFNPAKEFRLLSALIATFTSALIFFGKIPNEAIVLTFSLILLFYLLTKKNINLVILAIVVIFTLAISKIAWLILIPFVIFTLIFFQINLIRQRKIKIIVIALLLTLIPIILFMIVPQSGRSFLENDFPFLQDSGIKVTLDRFRGQGLEAGWPNFLERVLFNRLQIINVGLMNWLSRLEPASIFGQFDETGIDGFMSMGLFPKIAIIPFLSGLIFIIRKGDRRSKALIFYLLILTFPTAFIYPNVNRSIAITIIPFVTFIIAFGLMCLNRFLKIFCILLMVFEVAVNVFYISPDMKNSYQNRPIWIKLIIEDSYSLSINYQLAISDNLVSDIGPFLGWLSPQPIKAKTKNIQFPYKYRETEFLNIKIVGTNDNFYICGPDNPTYIFASNRDLAKIQKWLSKDMEIKKTYLDNLNNQVAYLVKLMRCLK